VSLDDTAAPELGRYGSVRDGWVYDSLDDAEADVGHPVDGGMIVRETGTAVIGGARFVVASDGSLIASRSVGTLTPSSFHGTPVDGELHVGWAYRATTVRATPDGAAVATLPMHAQVAVGDVSRGFVRIADNRWAARGDLRIPALTAPPAGVGDHDRWFDVDLHEQVLVAYEGARPVYATLVSTGRPDHATAAAVTRVMLKLRMTTMTNSGADESYSVADVPWVMYYADKLALHGAYWHDRFGELHSHGCVNLAPRDARVLFAWSAPEVPPGWSGVYANADAQGSVVRIH
jgi:lipoprotein-anchoring transpeptidase ErfK/SrfK